MTENKKGRRFTKSDMDQLIFFQTPKVLILAERYKKLKPNALKLYMVLLDRMKLSMKNGWHNDDGEYYVRMTKESSVEVFGWSESTFQNMKKELHKFGLLEEEREGLGKSNKLYVIGCEYTDEDIYRINKSEEQWLEDEENRSETLDTTMKGKSYTSASVKSNLHEVQSLTSIKNNLIKNNLNKNNISSSSSSRDEIDKNLKDKFPNVPFEEIKQNLVDDPTAIIKKDSQYKSMLSYRLKNWKPSASKKQQFKKSIREEIVPEWFDKNKRNVQNEIVPEVTEEDRIALKRELESMQVSK